MKPIVWLVGALFAMSTPGGFAQAQDDEVDLSGTWRGKAVFLLPAGVTEQIHMFKFEEPLDGFVKGEHSWSIPARNLTSNAGEGDAFEATEPFLGIVGSEDEVWLVEIGDVTMFRMHIVTDTRIEFIALEGGANAIVGRGQLTRDAQ